MQLFFGMMEAALTNLGAPDGSVPAVFLVASMTYLMAQLVGNLLINLLMKYIC